MILSKPKLISLLSNTKLVVGVVVFILVVELAWSYWYLNKPKSVTSGALSINHMSQQSAVKPTIMSLVSDKSIVRVGDKLTVSINIDSGRPIVGTDVVLSYDPSFLMVVPASVKAPTTSTSMFDTYPLNKIDEKNGKIFLSAVSTLSPVFPKGVLGSIQFQAKAVGLTTITFDFTKGATNKTNVVEAKTSNNVLDVVNNLSLNIQP